MFEKQKFLSNMQYTYYVLKNILINFSQRWSRGHKARGQGQGHKKKIRGQGQLSRVQNLSRPRTRKLEAKDQGHRRKGSPKKNFFQAISKKKVFKKKTLLVQE